MSAENLVATGLQDFYDDYYDDPRLAGTRKLVAGVLFNSLMELAGRQRLVTVLDVGAGEGSFLQKISDENIADELYAVEISESGVERIRRRQLPKLESVAQFDGYKLAFADHSIDLITSLHVLEHVEHERLFLRELARVGKSVFLEVPLENTSNVAMAIERASTGGHINYYNENTFLALLESSGLRVARMKTYAYPVEYEILVSGALKGRLKSLVRSAAIRFAPEIAKRRFVYLCAALAYPKGS
jgi:predicted TPR repeat methyltransferase